MTQGKTDLSSFENSWFKPGNKAVIACWFLVNSLIFNSYLFPFSGVKVRLLRLFGARVGQGVLIKPKVNIKYPWKLQIGHHCWIGENVWIDNLGLVTLGDHVCLSQGAMLLCGNHNYKSPRFELMVGDITLEDGVWIGAHAVVCPGVICASHAILAVNSVATSKLDSYGIYQGNPAILVRNREISIS